jgi:hypothetical protein
VWAAIVDLWRACPIKPGEQEQERLCQAAYDVYQREVRSRLDGADKMAALEREGRGPSEFGRKWRAAMKKWDTEVADDARKPPPKDDQQYDAADFETASAKAEEQAKTDRAHCSNISTCRRSRTSPIHDG